MANPVVTTQLGEISGSYNKEGDIAIFKGIPYAQPPVGPLRWKPPQPAAPWSGTLKAEKAGPVPVQVRVDSTETEEFVDAFLGGQGWGRLKTGAMKLMVRLAPKPKESEDCLTLNIRTPSLDREAKLPVMVWIHGSGYMVGSGEDMPADSNALARRGMVTVTINNRLGVMGYFAHPELSRESEYGVSGNYGTLDQIAALRWVQENISVFGGNPDNVTIFGESSGGESVAHMMTSPLARGLCHKAIMQSVSSPFPMQFLRQPFLTNAAGEELGQRFADNFAPPGEGQVKALRQLSHERLYQLIRDEWTFRTFNPVVDGYVLEKHPFEAFLDGDQARVPLLSGSNADEGTNLLPIMLTPVAGYRYVEAHQVADIVQERFGDLAETLFDLYPGLRQGEESAQVEFLGDNFVRADDHFYATHAAGTGQPVYRYLFTRTPPSPRQTAGAYHGAELPFVHGKKMPLFDFTEEDKALAGAMGDYWVQFARSGDPNLAPHPEWPAYTADDQRQMRLDHGADLGAIEIDRQAKLNLFRQHQEKLVTEMKQLRQGETEAVPA
ncbi:MAG: carboxylesterase family protein [Chloroflexota bacterium]|nr:MAG: carboxylesterase family protein [Chloroflexota bacterium]